MKIPERTDLLPDFSHLSAYERWGAQNWLHHPGTDAAQLHARAKLDEEVVELSDALATAIPEDIVSEAGDVLWTASATGSNAGITVSRSLTEMFPPIFHSSDISSHSIDEFASELYKDTPLNITQTQLKEYGAHLGKASKQWFRLSPLVRSDVSSMTFTEALITTKRQRTIDALAHLTLLTSYAVQEFATSTLHDAMSGNYQKIEGRIASGAAITKSPRV